MGLKFPSIDVLKILQIDKLFITKNVGSQVEKNVLVYKAEEKK